MKKQWSDEELKEVASQLRNPDGFAGVKTGERMYQSNANMISFGINSLEIKSGDSILEIGPGNGAHVSSMIEIAETVRYQGVDISQTMIEEANKLNADLVMAGVVSFHLSDGSNLEYADHTFDKIVSVNTVYFWVDPIAFAREIYRVLKPGGIFSLVFSHRNFMQQLPFTRFGFQLYDRESAEQLLADADFSILKALEEMEITRSNIGEDVERPLVAVVASK